jgi:hypothetical protein
VLQIGELHDLHSPIDDERSKSGFEPAWSALDSGNLQGKLDLYCDIPLSAAKSR